MGKGARAGVALLVAGVIGLVMAASGVAAGSETPVVVPVSEGVDNFNFAVTPKMLPKGGGPAELKVALEEQPGVGVPPGISDATVRLDKSIGFDFNGIPRCLYGVQIEPTPPNPCAESAVGRADATVVIAFAEAPPMTVEGSGTIYYVGRKNLLVERPFRMRSRQAPCVGGHRSRRRNRRKQRSDAGLRERMSRLLWRVSPA